MTRTKRIYNRHRFWDGPYSAYHPYKRLCMGSCQYCRRLTHRNKRKDVAERTRFRWAINGF